MRAAARVATVWLSLAKLRLQREWERPFRGRHLGRAVRLAELPLWLVERLAVAAGPASVARRGT